MVKGGPGALTAAMAEAAREAGAEIRTGARSRACSCATDAWRASSLDDGTEIPARGGDLERRSASARSCSCVDPVDLDPEFLTKAATTACPGTRREGQPRAGGAAGVPRHHATRRCSAGRIHIGPSIDYLERAFDASKYGEISPEPYLDITFPSLHDPSLAPAGPARDVGLHAVRAATSWPTRPILDGCAARRCRRSRRRDPRAVRARHRPAGRAAAGASHRTISRATYGLTGGHILHGEPSLDQLFTMRPMLGWARYRTPIDGLFLCGAGTHPGGGLTAASGQNAAREIVRTLKKWSRARPDTPSARCARRPRGRRRRVGRSASPGADPSSAPFGFSHRRARPHTPHRAPVPGASIRRTDPRRAPVPRRQAAPRRIAARPRAGRMDVRDRFTALGLEEVAITTHEVLLPWPEEDGRSKWWRRDAWRASMREDPIAGDPYTQVAAGSTWASPTTPTPHRAKSRRRSSTPEAATPRTTTARRAGHRRQRQDRARPLLGAVQLPRLQGADRAAARRRRHPDLLGSRRRWVRARATCIRTARGDPTATSSAAASSTTSSCRAIR